MRKIIVFVYFFLVLGAKLFPEDVFAEEYGYYLDMPDGWTLLDAANLARITFADPTQSAFLKVVAYPGETYGDAAAIVAAVKAQLKAEGDVAPFVYRLKDSALADLSFQSSGVAFRGYFICINGVQTDYVLFAITSTANFEYFESFLLSALDSFAIDRDSRYYPGPISSFYYEFPGKDLKTVEIPFFRASLSLAVDEKEVDASQVVIEREARVLMTYKETDTEAWARFYRMIYRDNYHRLDGLFSVLRAELTSRGQDTKTMALSLLAWIQNFSYARGETVSDLASPLYAVLSLSGDCDSLGLLYVILLHHLEIDAVLFVSSLYSHAGVGVEKNFMQMDGAAIVYGEKSFLYAEMTKKVALGMIAAEMANPDNWLVIVLGRDLY